MRWTAAGMLEATKGFRRLKAYKHLPIFRAALAGASILNSSANGLKTTLMPHSIVHGNACFAYFNKIWGIPTTGADLQLALNPR